jgi:hypothetical protein
MKSGENAHLVGVGAADCCCSWGAANSGAYPITPLPLAVSLKKALVFSGAEGHIPREHARRLLALLQLQGGEYDYWTHSIRGARAAQPR